MAEVQTSTSQGEMSLRFIEFVRMHSHNASLFLGRVPHPQTGQPQVNLGVGRMLLEQLVAIQLKTRGNLNRDEQAAIDGAIASLEQDYANASASSRKGP